MVSIFENLHPIVQALVAACFTWLLTALGAAVVFLVHEANRKVLDSMLGFAGGIMIAVSYWSLLAPAVAMARQSSLPRWFPATAGFLLGGTVLWIFDKLLPHLHPSCQTETSEGVKTPWHRSTLFFTAVTLHNIPEGLAIGVAFAAVAAGLESANLVSAVWLAIGIGIQNFPEGLAISMPLRHEGMSRNKAFFYGQLSAIVEPLAAVVGAAIVFAAQPLLPYALGFAAGAMIYIVIEEIIPGAQRCGNSDLATIGAMSGFAFMMILETAFG